MVTGVWDTGTRFNSTREDRPPVRIQPGGRLRGSAAPGSRGSIVEVAVREHGCQAEQNALVTAEHQIEEAPGAIN